MRNNAAMILAVIALVLTVASALLPVPLWIAVLLLCVSCLVR